MYTVYTHTTTATGASVVEDLAELIKGEVVVASLPGIIAGKAEASATTIDVSVNTTAWLEVESDYLAGNPYVVLKSAVTDDAAVFKFMKLTETAGFLSIEVFETWTPGAPGSGTNLVSISSRTFQWAGAGNPGVIHISASNRHVLLNVGTGGGATGTRYGPFGIVEHTRRSAWDTTGNGFPPFGYFDAHAQGGQMYGSPRTLDAYFNVEVFNQAGFIQSVYAGGGNLSIIQQRTTVDTTLSPVHALVSFGQSNSTLSNEGGDISSLCNIYLASNSAGSSFDELTVTPNTYVLWDFFLGSNGSLPAGTSQTLRWAVLKG